MTALIPDGLEPLAAWREVSCAACGQREGPFSGRREAERILYAYGWRWGSPADAWNGISLSWEPGRKPSWWCTHHAGVPPAHLLGLRG